MLRSSGPSLNCQCSDSESHQRSRILAGRPPSFKFAQRQDEHRRGVRQLAVHLGGRRRRVGPRNRRGGARAGARQLGPINFLLGWPWLARRCALLEMGRSLAWRTEPSRRGALLHHPFLPDCDRRRPTAPAAISRVASAAARRRAGMLLRLPHPVLQPQSWPSQGSPIATVMTLPGRCLHA